MFNEGKESFDGGFNIEKYLEITKKIINFKITWLECILKEICW